MAEESGFLSRWSRRKAEVRSGVVPAEPVVPPAAPVAELPLSSNPPAAEVAREEEPPPPPPTLDDVAALTTDSDFSRFVKPDVDAPVRNAAMKKLFTDPHFNVMDGLDTYIDDYGKPDPLPESMLRQMASAAFLGLFDDEKKTTETPGETPTETNPAPTENPADEDADLRLQQDDAAGRREPPQGARA